MVGYQTLIIVSLQVFFLILPNLLFTLPLSSVESTKDFVRDFVVVSYFNMLFL